MHSVRIIARIVTRIRVRLRIDARNIIYYFIVTKLEHLHNSLGSEVKQVFCEPFLKFLECVAQWRAFLPLVSDTLQLALLYGTIRNVQLPGNRPQGLAGTFVHAPCLDPF